LIALVVCFGYDPAFVGYPGSRHFARRDLYGALGGHHREGHFRRARGIAVINTGWSAETPPWIAACQILRAVSATFHFLHCLSILPGDAPSAIPGKLKRTEATHAA
jgi:hypothetical protein